MPGPGERAREGKDASEERQNMTVEELLPKLRWTTIGWSYDWTSKTYDFDRPQTPLPPLIHRCCRDVVRSIPWNAVFESTSTDDQTDLLSKESDGWRKWATDYEPEAGVINFVGPLLFVALSHRKLI